jgi:pilus assembly protein Flp/PilA
MPSMKRALQDQSGATGVEYALIGALIFLAWLGAMTMVGGNTTSMYNRVAGAISNATAS